MQSIKTPLKNASFMVKILKNIEKNAHTTRFCSDGYDEFFLLMFIFDKSKVGS